ncbi:MAG: 50S ribosomal protein L15 [Magnetococcales bacterium]|nr:50S ribosomal protein L15 [Magnetococcales bacterium]
MKLNELPACPINRKEANRVGRGMASGNGKTSGRGQKGQKSRSGGFHKVGFEGGQMPLQRRIPKRGFNNIFRKEYSLINIEDLEVFDAGSEINLEVLRAKGLVRKDIKAGIKLLGNGSLTKKLSISVDRISKSAQEKVEKAGGTVTLSS